MISFYITVSIPKTKTEYKIEYENKSVYNWFVNNFDLVKQFGNSYLMTDSDGYEINNKNAWYDDMSSSIIAEEIQTDFNILMNSRFSGNALDNCWDINEIARIKIY